MSSALGLAQASAPANGSNGNRSMRGELRVEDALLYLDQVKVEFGDRPHIYNEFLDIMKTFKTQQIDTPGVIRRVSNLFQGNRRLVLGFNTFLPEGYQIEIPPDGRGPPIAVYRPPGSDVSHILRESAESRAVSVAQVTAMENAQQQQQQQLPPQEMQQQPPRQGQPRMMGQPPPPPPPPPPPDRQTRLPLDPGGVAPRSTGPQQNVVPPRGQQPLPGGVAPRVARPPVPRDGMHLQRTGSNSESSLPPPPPPQQQQPTGQPPMEFDHAINYVTTIKRRFADDPNTYKKFLEILHTYQKEQRGIKEVLDEVSDLFEDHPDLLKEFTFFLPDAVQSQAKAQLDQVVKVAEARKRAKAQAAIMDLREGMVPPPRPAPPPPPSPTARSVEREENIIQSVRFGSVSFAPVRPRRYKPGTMRPTAVPVPPLAPTPREATVLQRVKDHLLYQQQQIDPKQQSHRLWMEFCKCLHMFGAGICNQDELIVLWRSLLPNPKSTHTHELMVDLEELLQRRGPWVVSDDAKEYDKQDVENQGDENAAFVSPSYFRGTTRALEYPGRTAEDAAVINTGPVALRKRKSPLSLEDYRARKRRHHQHEQSLQQIEEERFELDMALERNLHALKRLEPIVREVEALREREEKDNQPIGRLQYSLLKKNTLSLNTVHLNAIARLYGDRGDDILQHLVRDPMVVLPIVFKRLQQKDTEWRQAKHEMKDRWNAVSAGSYEGSLDVKCLPGRRALEKYCSPHRLVDHCQRAISYLQHPERVKQHPATQLFAATFVRQLEDPGAVVYQPGLVVQCHTPVDASHYCAYRLVMARLQHTGVTPFQSECIGRIWAECVVPWYEYPVHWIANDLRTSFRGNMGRGIVQCT